MLILVEAALSDDGEGRTAEKERASRPLERVSESEDIATKRAIYLEARQERRLDRDRQRGREGVNFVDSRGEQRPLSQLLSTESENVYIRFNRVYYDYYDCYDYGYDYDLTLLFYYCHVVLMLHSCSMHSYHRHSARTPVDGKVVE